MTEFKIVYWKNIPAQIIATDEHGKVEITLPDRFHDAIHRLSTAMGMVTEDLYLSGWRTGKSVWRADHAEEVVEDVQREIERIYPQEKLEAIIREAERILV